MPFKRFLANLALILTCLANPASALSPADLQTDDWLAQAGWLEKRQDWPNLLIWGQTWSRFHPEQPSAWFVMGRALSELQRPHEAIIAYQQNLKLDPGDLYAHHNLGNLYRKLRLYGPAMLAYRDALRTRPDYIPAWQNLGLAYYEQRGVEGVAQALRQLQTSDPVMAAAWRKLAVEYALTRNDAVAQEAIQVLKSLDPAKRERLFASLFDTP